MRLLMAGLVAAALVQVGCTDIGSSLFPDDIPDADQCGNGAATPNLAGSWRLTGSGTRSGCSDDRFEGAFVLRSEAGLTVIQDAPDAGSSSSASQRLRLDSPPEGLSFLGNVQGTCVHVEIHERYEDQVVLYSFDGSYSSSTGGVAGDFTGVGPSNCAVSGTFSLQVQ